MTEASKDLLGVVQSVIKNERGKKGKRQVFVAIVEDDGEIEYMYTDPNDSSFINLLVSVSNKHKFKDIFR